MGKYRIEDLEVGMHVKIPRKGAIASSSWSVHLKEDRWWEITAIKDNVIGINDGLKYGYHPSWVSECMELDALEFSPIEDIQFLFEMMVIS